MSEVRALGSTGITRLHRYYDPLRDPSQPSSWRRRSVCTAGSGLPLLTRIAFSACRAHYPGGSVRCFSVDTVARSRAGLFPNRSGLPVHNGRSASTVFVSRPARASLVLRPADLLTHLCGLGCEASMKSVTRLHRSSAIQAYRDLLVRDFHPLVIRAARAHDLLQIAAGDRNCRYRN